MPRAPRVKLERRSVLLPDLAVQDPAVHRQAAVRTQLDAVAGDAVLQGGTQLVVLALVFVEQVAERLAAQLRARSWRPCCAPTPVEPMVTFVPMSFAGVTTLLPLRCSCSLLK